MGTPRDSKDARALERPPVTAAGRWRFAVLLASFGINFLVMATTRCTGVLFTSFQNAFVVTTAHTGAISSIMSATALFGASLGGVLGNHIGYRRTAMVGGVLSIVGLVGGALTTNVYQMYVVGSLAGLGNGVAFNPAVVMTAMYFKKNYTWANAFMTTGDSIGMLVFPPVMQLLLDSYGWRGTVLVTGAISANICVAAAIYRPIRPARADRKKFRPILLARKVRKKLNEDENDHIGEDENDHIGEDENDHIGEDENDHIGKDENDHTGEDENGGEKPAKGKQMFVGFLSGIVTLLRLRLLRQSYRFAAFCFSKTSYFTAYGCFLIYLIPYANSLGIQDQRAAFLISISGVASIAGRALCGLINRRVSSAIIYQASMLVCGCGILVAQGGTHAYLATSAAILGFSIGFQHTIETVMLREFVGVDNLGSAVGIFSGFGGVADLIGPIVAGALYDATDSFSLLFYVFAAIFFLGFLVILLEPLLRRIEPGVTYAEVKAEHV